MLEVHWQVVSAYGGNSGLVSRAALERVVSAGQLARSRGLAAVAAAVGVAMLQERPFKEHNDHTALTALMAVIDKNGKKPLYLGGFVEILHDAAERNSLVDLIGAIERSIEFGERRKRNPRKRTSPKVRVRAIV